MSLSSNNDSLSTRRRLSFGSNLSSRQDLAIQIFQRHQQVISVQIFFEEEAPTVAQLREMAQLLGTKYERMRGIPWDLPGDTSEGRVFKDVADFSAALDVLVQDHPLEDDTEEQARIVLEKVKLKSMLAKEGGIEVPLWRFYRVGSKSLVLTIDHAIGDGLALSAILAVVATEGADTKTPLPLEKVSPLFSVLCKSTPWQRFIWSWAFLWPPNFLKCVKVFKVILADGADPITPLSPTDAEEIIESKQQKRIPANFYGTVYLCPLPVALFKSLARADGKKMTVNDVLSAAIGDMVRRYLKSVGYEGKTPLRFVTPLAAPTKSPDSYFDESEGLGSRFAPIGHYLPLENNQTSTPFRDILNHMHNDFQIVKQSFVTSLVYALLRLMGRFAKPSSMVEETKNGIGKASFVWSNVPGPSVPIYICGGKVTEIQCLVSNPWCMMQTCSYNGMVFTSIQVDVRTTIESHKLSEAFVETMTSAITELLTGSEQENALRTLKESASGFKPGPYLSPIDV